MGFGLRSPFLFFISLLFFKTNPLLLILYRPEGLTNPLNQPAFSLKAPPNRNQ